MKISINKHKKIQTLRKTHNLYLYNEGRRVYYKAIPKRNVKVIRERRSYLWPMLAVLAIVCATVAKSMGSKPETYAEPVVEDEVIEVITNEETTESVTENKGEEVTYTGVCAEWYDIVAQYDWDVEVALKIMYAESRCNPNAIGENKKADGTVWSRDYGLMQINDYWHDVTGWNDPATNIKKAYEIYKSGGWGRWSTYKFLGK